MKSIFFIRHAKSSWDNASISDFERPLNERGKHDAPEMAKRLAKKDIKIDAFISSPAKRAKKTAQIFADAFDVEKESIIYVPELYNATVPVFSKVIKSLDEELKNIAIFSHNPGITEFVNTLTSEIRIDNIPTCGIFAVHFPEGSWSEFDTATKEFWFFDYPKLKS
jgi:phosphohistidine phosphatase